MVAATLAVCAAGCDEPLSSITGPTPDLKPTFSSIQQQIFENGDSSGRPACITCHNPARAQFVGGLDLSHNAAYAALVGTSSREQPARLRVAAGDPEASYLIHKIEGRSDITGGRMPLNGPYLEAGQIAVIARWVELGANND